MDTKLWYKSPAKSFNDALPIGNGNLGAIVYGGIPNEKISLNQDTFWSGRKPTDTKEVSKEHINSVRNYIFRGEYKKAEELLEKHLLGEYNESYLPLAEIFYNYENIGDIINYKRSLDLETAIVSTTFESQGTQYHSEVFASYKDKGIIIRIKSSKMNGLNLTVGMDSQVIHHTEIINSNTILLSETAPSHVVPNYVISDTPIIYDDKNPGMKCKCMLGVYASEGSISKDGNRIRVTQASELFLYFVAENGYRGYFQNVEENEQKIYENAQKNLMNLQSKTYEEIRKNHISDYQELFNRVKFTLSQNRDDLPTSERLERLKAGEEDKGLYCLYFHYSRYLMISSSRKNSQPANLQGIWNDSIRPVWSSNWTININTEMNYWMVGPCNLLECHEPFLQMVKELSIAGQKTAAQQFHCRGWVANHNVDLWRQTYPVAGLAKYAYWPMGGVWLAIQIYDYYRYSLDKEYLLKEAFPVMTGAARFCLDWMVKGPDGRYHTVPSTSPENTFLDDAGRECGVSYSSTMDIALIKELFLNLKEAYEMLDHRDALYYEMMECLSSLPDYKIDQNGCIQEWFLDLEEKNPGHRHFSPIVGFHPGKNINKRDHQELVAACKKLIERRLQHGSGHIGWSCAWLVNLYARLEDGEKAYDCLSQLLKNSTYDNLFDLHPPLGENDGEREVFQIDGNFGSAAGIAAMFMQSYLDEIEILPALPDNWTEGKIEGLLAEGGFEVSIEWRGKSLTEMKIKSLHGGLVRIRYCRPIKLSDGKNIRNINYIAPNIIEFLTIKGECYEIKMCEAEW